MNRQELPRIRLKVATNAGINILCTALRTWKVVQWLPHIEQAYREVKEDQEGDQDSKRRFIKAIRIKKGDFYIANSELIGDIFEDNDEVQCQIFFPPVVGKFKKERKIQKKGKKQEKILQEGDEEQQDYQNKEKDIQIKSNNKDGEIKDNQSPKKKKKKQPQKQSHQPTEQPKKPLKEKKQSKSKSKTSQSNKKQHEKSQLQEASKSFQQKLIKKVDFSKLKSILNTKNNSKIQQQPLQFDLKVQIQSSQSQSSQQEQV